MNEFSYIDSQFRRLVPDENGRYRLRIFGGSYSTKHLVVTQEDVDDIRAILKRSEERETR